MTTQIPLSFTTTATLPSDHDQAHLVGRVFRPNQDGPSVVTLRGNQIFDITAPGAATVRDICEMADPAGYVAAATGEVIGPVGEILANSWEPARDQSKAWLLAPIDLQAIKACGVTFAVSLLERVIEEQARGVPAQAQALRSELNALLGADIMNVKPGSQEAARLKSALTEKGVWSQYLEVGIGPDPEIFTKSQPLSAVGTGARTGILPESSWNNPEPEIAVAVASTGRPVGATLGNDVNLRDIEGRSALLLGKAKDNNASCALGPFLRLFDSRFTLDDIRQAEISLMVDGVDGFQMQGASSMHMISRDIEELTAATLGTHHQYPDGFVLFLGTMFAPIDDRDTPGQGFTHKRGDVVTVATDCLGALTNEVAFCEECAPWDYGMSRLMQNLAARHLLGGRSSAGAA